MPQRIGIAIVVHDGAVLVGTRADGAVLAGKQEFPGGKCEPGESPAECAIRECLEETGFRVQVDELLMRTVHEYAHGIVELHFFLCRLADSTDHSTAGAEEGDGSSSTFRWVPVPQLDPSKFPEGNRDALQKLRARFGVSGPIL